MSHALLTVLVSLTLPAITLAIIFVMERSGKERQGESHHVAIDPSPAPEVHSALGAETMAKALVEEPRYRERAG